MEAVEIGESYPLVEAINWMDFIPYEIIWIILQFCGVNEWVALGKTCRRIHETVDGFLNREVITPTHQHVLKNAIKPFKSLYVEQLRGLIALQCHPKSSIFLRSPMGSGKTLMAVLHAFDMWKTQGIRTMIIATAKCIGSWEEHLKRVGLKIVKSRPERSDYILFHSNAPKHRKYVTLERMLTSQCFILLTTHYYTLRAPYAYRVMNDLVEERVFDQVIVDEAHLMKDWRFVNKANRRILLSADAMNLEVEKLRLSNPTDYYDEEFDLSCDFTHSVKMELKLLPREKHIPTLSITECTLAPLISLFLDRKFKGKKVILFTQWNSSAMKASMTILKRVITGYKFFKFNNTNLAAKTKFARAEKSVLVTTIHTATEGTNFEMADTAIYTNFGSGISLGKARQCFARVRRRNNPNPVIMNYAFYIRGDPVHIIRTRTNIAYALAEDIDLVLTNKRMEAIRSIAKRMIEDGIDIMSIPEPELLTIFTSNHSPDPLPFKQEDYSFPLMDIVRYMHIS